MREIQNTMTPCEKIMKYIYKRFSFFFIIIITIRFKPFFDVLFSFTNM